MWQDGFVSDADETTAGSGQEQPAARAGLEVEALRALADPLRLRILTVMMVRVHGELPVMSVKELAADLGEPQTKLYRHVKHLESAGLIKVVASRVVSGIVEQRYQAGQDDLMIGTSLDGTQKASAEAEAAAAAILELYRSEFFAVHRSNLAASQVPGAPERDPDHEPMLSASISKVPRAKAAEIRARLLQLAADLSEAESLAEAEDEDTVSVSVLLGYFTPDAGG
jgi:DNA-binding transcriptional ArsR family regulator